MRSLIVGTAGHVDHGKSTLVHVLTGIDPDRLKEEKERGITTDLGFAHAVLPDDLRVSFIDVPGHERFVRNMLAGAHGMDAVLLVVAADESVMPQTREHFEICRLLGIGRGAVVVTKSDLADEAQLARVERDVRELVVGSFLEGAAVVRTAARTGAGLDELRSVLASLAATRIARAREGLLRLPIDRVFTLRGFGTVVTGTLRSGQLSVGDDVELLPSGHRARVRALEVHGQSQERVEAGERTAANLSGIDVAQVERGDVVATPGTLRPTSMLDVELSMLASAKPLPEGTRVRVHAGSADVLARVRLLGAPQATPGSPALAQLRLEGPVVAGRGDRLVIRSASPQETIGGARVLNPLPPKRNAGAQPRLAALAALADDDVAGAALLLVEEAGLAGMELGALSARLTLSKSALAARLRGTAGLTVTGANSVWSKAALAAIEAKAVAALAEFHAAEPLRETMPLEALRRAACGRRDEAFEPVLAALVARGAVRVVGDGVSAPGHEVRLSDEDAASRATLLQAAADAAYEGFEVSELPWANEAAKRRHERVLRSLLETRVLRRLPEGRTLDGALFEGLVREIQQRWPSGNRLDVTDFKAMTGLTRKFAIPLLEYLDHERVTRRVGSDRIVL